MQRTDKNGKQRNWIRTADDWIPYAQYVWAEAYGPIPRGPMFVEVTEAPA